MQNLQKHDRAFLRNTIVCFLQGFPSQKMLHTKSTIKNTVVFMIVFLPKRPKIHIFVDKGSSNPLHDCFYDKHDRVFSFSRELDLILRLRKLLIIPQH